MSTVVEIPGVGEVEFPDSMGEQEIAAAIGSMGQGQIIPNAESRPLSQQLIPGVEATTVSGVGARRHGSGEAFFRAGAERVSDAAANIPNILLNTGRRIPAQLGMVPPEDAPSLGERVIPTPSGREFVAGVEAAIEAPIAAARGQQVNLSEMYGRNLADAEQLAREHPTASLFGEMAADAATIVAGRAPVARARAPVRKAQREAAEAEAKRHLDMIPDEIREQFDDVFSRKAGSALKVTGQRLGRAGVKAGEAGLEGATLAALHGGDPSEMFGFAAGTQAAGSLGLFAVEAPVKRLAPWVGAAFLASEMFKAAMPGDQSFFDSKDFAIRKAVMAFSAGAISAMAGAGRLRGPTADKYPVVFDAITTTPRAALIGRLQELRDSAEVGNNLPLRTMEKFSSNPEAFTEAQQKSLGRALVSEKRGEFTKEVDRLMRQSKTFREVMRETAAPDL